MSNLFQVTEENFDEEILRSEIPVVVDFWADWCQPCKAMEPMIQDLARIYHGRIKIVQMNVAENIKTPARFGIRNLPTLMFFKKGEVVHTLIGAFPKSLLEKEMRNMFQF